MRIAMFTNTYHPHVGGVARSVGQFTDELRRTGHDVLVVAPTFPDMEEGCEGELRVPALQRFNGSDFSVAVPLPGALTSRLEAFAPDVIHAHHPFLLGAAALRFARSQGLPIVFTHHTMYERYTHYVPGDSPTMQEFAIELGTGFANLCDQVIAPSESIAEVLRERGVETPITELPTGVEVDRFADGDGAAFREKLGIPSDATVVGHLGRLAPEKNLPFLARAAARALLERPGVHFLVVGKGPSQDDVVAQFEEAGIRDRLHFAGQLSAQDLIDAYHAMDLFIFASETETQGMVLIEAMAAGVPVVALDAPGAREVVKDGENGRLIMEANEERFAEAILEMLAEIDKGGEALRTAALSTAEGLSMHNTAERLVRVYGEMETIHDSLPDEEETLWHQAMARLWVEWDLLQNALGAATGAVQTTTLGRKAKTAPAHPKGPPA